MPEGRRLSPTCARPPKSATSALRFDDRQNAPDYRLRLLRERRLDYSSEDTVPFVGLGRTPWQG